MNSSTNPDTTPSQALHIALLEDDVELRERILIPGLTDFGFDVTGTATAAELYRRMLTTAFDIVVLDIGLPDEDGLTVARHLRAISTIGIVMLTGNCSKQDRVQALTVGADAYLSKPVDIEVLAATLHSLWRRLRIAGMATSQSSASAHAVASTTATSWHLDTDGWCLVSPNGTVLAMTSPERCLVDLLIKSNGQPVTRETLIAALSNDVYNFDPHRLEMLVHRLRRKAAEAGAEPLPLLTARGQGYLFVSQP